MLSECNDDQCNETNDDFNMNRKVAAINYRLLLNTINVRRASNNGRAFVQVPSEKSWTVLLSGPYSLLNGMELVSHPQGKVGSVRSVRTTAGLHPTIIVSTKASLKELRSKTQQWLKVPVGLWTPGEVSHGRYLLESWLTVSPSNKDRARWSSSILRRWVKERLTETEVVTFTSAEIVEMLHRTLHSWRLLDNDKSKEDTFFECLDLLDLVEDAYHRTRDERIRPGSKAYSMVFGALASLPRRTSTCDDADQLLERCLRQTNSPDVQLFNACLQVYAKCSPYREDAAERAEKLLRSMTRWVHPDTTSFSSVLQAWAGSKRSGAAERAQAILEQMMVHSKDIKVDSSCFNICIDAWGRAGFAETAESLLWRLHQLHKSGLHEDLKPDSSSFNSAIIAWSKSQDPQGPENAERLLQTMISYDIPATTESFTAVMDAWSRKLGTGPKVQELLQRFEYAYLSGKDSACPSTLSYLCAIRAWCNTNDSKAPEYAEGVINQMEIFQEATGRSDLAPCVHIYSAVIDVWSNNSLRPDAPERALDLLRKMQMLSEAGNQRVHPNTVTYNSVLSAFARQGMIKQVESLLEEMRTRQLHGDNHVQPNTITFSTVIHALAKSPISDAAERATDLLHDMMALSEDGAYEVSPTTQTYTSVLFAWGNSRRHDAAAQAETLFRSMLSALESGVSVCAPNAITLNCVLRAWSRSSEGGAAERAESIFKWMEDELARGNTDIQPDSRTFLHLITAWARSGRKNAPLHAQKHLERVKELYQSKTYIRLTTAHFNATILAWANSGQPEAGTRAKELFDEMMALTKFGHDLAPDVVTYNLVLRAIIGNDAVHQSVSVSELVNTMESQGIQPNDATKELLEKYFPQGSLEIIACRTGEKYSSSS